MQLYSGLKSQGQILNLIPEGELKELILDRMRPDNIKRVSLSALILGSVPYQDKRCFWTGVYHYCCGRSKTRDDAEYIKGYNLAKSTFEG